PRRLVFPVADCQVRGWFSIGIKSRVPHPERIKDALLEKSVERHAADNFNNTRRRVNTGLSVLPLRAWLVLHGGGQEQGDELSQSVRTRGSFAVGFAQAGGMG